MSEYYIEAMDRALLNDGISYLIVVIEKNGVTEKKKFEIDEQESDFYTECFSILKSLTKQGYKIIAIETVRYWEY